MISVIIPTADRPGPLHRALRSLARQTFRDFEVIVVRDGGPPVRTVVDSWKNHLPITLIDTDPRRGVSHARNTALAAARGEYVAFLDDDDVYLPEHLATAHRALEAGHADVVYGGALVSSRWIEAVPRTPHDLPRKDYPFDDAFLLAANYIHTGSVVARNFAATTVRFDEQMNHCEDWALWLALRHTLGYRFAFLGEITSVYHQVPHPSAVSSAYLASPTPFTRARACLYETWPSSDPLVRTYRDWFRRFDARLDARIRHGRPIPAHIYEHAVRGLHPGFIAAARPAPALLDSLLHTTGASGGPLLEAAHAAG
ncbi:MULTISPECIES: glycosyltransferase family 2 protein [Streptomyces]|uniref:glycosyltransferase family 2 protein n=1 Tax=Streptomyces TaxID=1883 RepID=UPI00226F19E1|nr:MULTISPECIES: glycosyltransferase family A protein [unclassified Streptomyces]MCY0940171.1 glycosyltransferase family A protein [Streptomyces sp. H34-AA3]MCZ4080818.1 glycosyltransferase family A protein [Streptomyces sp. H34-S5]